MQVKLQAAAPAYTAGMRLTPSLTTKLLAMGMGFLLTALASIGLTLWVTWKLEGGAAAVNEAGRLRMLVLRTTLAWQTQGLVLQQAAASRFDARLALLRQGDPARPLAVPWTQSIHRQFTTVQWEWQALQHLLRSPLAAAPPAAAAAQSRELQLRADALVQLLDTFVDAIETELARWTSALHLFQLGMVGLAIAMAVTFMAMSYWLVIGPMGRLRAALARVAGGRLDTRLDVGTNDEWGQLARDFNRMAEALQSAHDDVQSQLRETTRCQAVQQAHLEALHAVSAQVAEAGCLQAMAQACVQQVRAVAGADAAALRWGEGAGAREVPVAAAESQGTLLRPPWHPPALALPGGPGVDAQTMVCIPVRLQQQQVGEVLLYFRQPQALPAEVRAQLTAMASLLAGALPRPASGTAGATAVVHTL